MVLGAIALDGTFDLADLLLRALDARALELPGDSPDDRIGTDRQKRRRNENLGESEAVLGSQASPPAG